ncbi:SDR family NAD(P)-dependent oxidoreductase [Patescibacteria group bacterium]|nr:SDR family NAD(P)-dependent oxidoreductase [Patescibacteria group bacterium]
MNILITGAATGIGKSLADKFSKEGYTVISTYHTTKGPGYHLDLSNESDIKTLVNNIGVSTDKVVEVVYNTAMNKYKLKNGADIKVRDYRFGTYLRIPFIVARKVKKLAFS